MIKKPAKFLFIGLSMKISYHLGCKALCVFSLSLSLGFNVGCSRDQSPSEPAAPVIQVTAALRQDLPLNREFVGRTIGSVDADVRAQVQGTLLAQHFNDGSEVSEGQLLYTIEDAPYVAKVAQAKGQLAEAQTKLSQANADLARIKPLADIDAVSKRDLDMANSAKGVAEGAVQAAEAQVQAAEIQLGYTKVTAPVSGTIGISKLKVGEVVGTGPASLLLNTVSKLDPIYVQFTLSEKEYLYFANLARLEGEERKKRQLTLVLADGSVHPEKGEVVKVDRSVDVASGSITVEASFPNPGNFLRPGLFAKVKTVAETRRDAILIPKKAIKDVQGTSQIYVVSPDGQVEQRLAQLGPVSGELQVIESGVSEGELVAIDGIQRLRTGMTVKPNIVTIQ